MSLKCTRHRHTEDGVAGNDIATRTGIEHWQVGPSRFIGRIFQIDIRPRIDQLITERHRSHALGVGHLGRDHDILSSHGLLRSVSDLTNIRCGRRREHRIRRPRSWRPQRTACWIGSL